jgi:bifunctional non-homologous end joining protein LigD
VVAGAEAVAEAGAESKVFAHACRLGLEGIISKRRDLEYRSGRCASWLKIKNPAYER